MVEGKQNSLKGEKRKHRTVDLYQTSKGLVVVCWDGFIKDKNLIENGFLYQSYVNPECYLHVWYSRSMSLDFVTHFVKKNKQWLIGGMENV